MMDPPGHFSWHAEEESSEFYEPLQAFLQSQHGGFVEPGHE